MLNSIIEQNIGLVKSCISKFLFKSSDYEDIFQAGCLGLTRAAKIGEIKDFFHNNNKLKLSRNHQKIYGMINIEKEKFYNENNREPTLLELSERLGISTEDILEALESHQTVSSIDDDNYSEKSEISEESHEKLVNTKIDIRNAIDKLSPEDQKIIKMRFFESKTQSDSAKILGMTQVQISRREKKILKYLRASL